MTEDAKRLGRANGGGFYEYPDNGRKYLWPELKTYFPLSKNTLSQEEIIDRLQFIQAVETIRCYEEGVLNSVAEANIGSNLAGALHLLRAEPFNSLMTMVLNSL